MSPIPQSLTEADIFTRLVNPQEGNLPQEVSHLILELHFEEKDITRMNELAEKNNVNGSLKRNTRNSKNIYESAIF